MNPEIAAVVLAAGLSRRMGRPKLTLAWGGTTVIGHVVDVLYEAGVKTVIIVTGGAHDLVSEALGGKPVEIVFNPRFAEDQMALSLQTGLAALPESAEAVLVVLGDQPQIETAVVRAVIAEYCSSKAVLVAPSYQMHRGHPWLIERSLWPEILAIRPPTTLRDFLAAHADQMLYLSLDHASILQDLDTPDDYARQAPETH